MTKNATQPESVIEIADANPRPEPVTNRNNYENTSPPPLKGKMKSKRPLWVEVDNPQPLERAKVMVPTPPLVVVTLRCMLSLTSRKLIKMLLLLRGRQRRMLTILRRRGGYLLRKGKRYNCTKKHGTRRWTSMASNHCSRILVLTW